MPKAQFEPLLAGTAVALLLTLSFYNTSTFAESAKAGANALAAATNADPASTGTTNPAQATPAPAKLESAQTEDSKPASEAVKPEPAATENSKAVPDPVKPEPAKAETSSPVPAAAAPASTAPVKDAKATTARSIADAAIADKLREQLTSGKFDRILGGKKERTSVEAFYAGREFAPLWITDGAMNERAKAATTFLSHVDADGLDPNDYPLPELKNGAAPETMAEAEIRFTDTILTFARHAQTGRVHYSRVAADILYNLVKPVPDEVLAKLAGAKDIGAALDSYNPQQPGYQALKAKLAELRNGSLEAKTEKSKPVAVRIADGKTLRPGMSDPRVPALRKRLDLEGNKNNLIYDDKLAEAVKTFQMSADIGVDGMLGPNTVRALNGDPVTPHRSTASMIDTVIANMERWRWMPRELGKTYVMVNIPDFSLRVVRDDKLVWKTKIVVGKPNLPTPIISAEMKYITVNPTWNVPPSIIQNEYLPALQQDPQAMERIGLKVSQEPDGTIRIWQPPGDKNALGRIRFNFPNKFLVYQHDTPDKYLFAKETRAFSHGCMRVENPLKYGEVLLSQVLPKEHYTEERLRKMFGGAEININFPVFIPVHITYQTAFVDDNGKLVIRDDIYGRDARQLAVMKGSDRRVADIAMERPKNNSTAPVRLPPGTFGESSDGGIFGSGPSFFERLFGGSSAPPRPVGRVGRAEGRHQVR
jgi:murein L,D-transpeptidase YcbB/YkuD